jgi:hypothetical protein
VDSNHSQLFDKYGYSMAHAKKWVEDGLTVDGIEESTVWSGETIIPDDTKIGLVLGEYDDCRDVDDEEWEIVDSVLK